MLIEKMLKFVRLHGMLCYEDADSGDGIVIEVEWYHCITKKRGRDKFIAKNLNDCREILGY